MFEDVLAAADDVLTPPFRNALVKTILFTLGLLALLWAVLEKLLAGALALPYPWLTSALTLIGGAGLMIGLAFLIPSASFLIAGFFFDDLADAVERELRPGATAGQRLALHDALWLAVRFSAVALVVNLAALLLLLVPGVNAIAFFAANAYLFGRGYFELAASRRLPPGEVRRLRKRHEPRLFAAGLILAAMLAVPVLNLLTPLFGTALFVRITAGILREPMVSAPRGGESPGRSGRAKP
ncbi:EI24 domain-containing protein [Methylocapsa palsarum]|uniref:CysZ protein n=1 Tax=Methylocapsa palsarum TaxID=1612308 RepID=A0A1I3ZP36_9HYPH|nr:EI24 domain-containing protein [Methylocapsa palsarum]SFK45855.1 CysZ protein [Methylocapsa palsarum]